MKEVWKYFIDWDIWIKKVVGWDSIESLQDTLESCVSRDARNYVIQKFNKGDFDKVKFIRLDD